MNPSSANLTGTSAAAFTVSVTTTARSGTAMIGSVSPRPSGTAGWMFALMIVGLFGEWCEAGRRLLAKIPAQAKTGLGRGTRGILFAAVFVVLIGMIACGSGGTPPKTPVQTGTPAGTYTMVVTAMSGSTTHTQNLTLTVN